MGLSADTFGDACVGGHPLLITCNGQCGFGLAARCRFADIGMAKLTSLKPVLGALPPRIGRMPGREAYDQDRNSIAWRGWYKLARWRKLRMAVFVRDHFTCQMRGCGRVEGNTSLLVADHSKAHRGDERLFWDDTNLQTLCAPCHNSLKQREEARSR